MEKELLREILRSCRGRMSARAFSQRLRLGPGQINRWESGHTQMSWADFVLFCERAKLPLAEAMRRHLRYDGTPKNVGALVRYLSQGRGSEQICDEWGISRPTLSRWLTGKSAPSTAAVLKIMAKRRFRLGDFAMRLVPADRRTSRLESLLEKMAGPTRTLSTTPYMMGLLCLITTADFEREPLAQLVTKLSQRTGFSVATIRRDVQFLMDAGVLRWDSDEKIFRYDGQQNVNLETDADFFTRSSVFWNLYALEFIKRNPRGPADPNLCGYLVLACDEDGVKEIRESFSRFFHEVETITSRSKENTQVLVLNASLTDVDSVALGRVFERHQDEVARVPLNPDAVE